MALPCLSRCPTTGPTGPLRTRGAATLRGPQIHPPHTSGSTGPARSRAATEAFTEPRSHISRPIVQAQVSRTLQPAFECPAHAHRLTRTHSDGEPGRQVLARGYTHHAPGTTRAWQPPPTVHSRHNPPGSSATSHRPTPTHVLPRSALQLRRQHPLDRWITPHAPRHCTCTPSAAALAST